MSNWQDKLSTLVYSTDGGKVDNKPKAPTTLGEGFKDGVIKLTRQTKGRKGKGVIVIEGIVLPTNEFKQMAQKIKKKCGTGGAVKENTIEIQGDDREKVKSVLESLGYVCKLAGG